MASRIISRVTVIKEILVLIFILKRLSSRSTGIMAEWLRQWLKVVVRSDWNRREQPSPAHPLDLDSFFSLLRRASPPDAIFALPGEGKRAVPASLRRRFLYIYVHGSFRLAFFSSSWVLHLTQLPSPSGNFQQTRDSPKFRSQAPACSGHDFR